MSNKLQSHQILKSWWKRSQSLPHSISLRAIAKKIKISPGYLSKIFSGKIFTPQKLIKPISKILNMDPATQSQWIEALTRETIKKNIGNTPLMNRNIDSDKNSPLDAFELGPVETEWLLEKWHRTALLDLTTLKNFENDHTKIANRLGISIEEVQRSIRYFLESGLLILTEDGHLKKKYLHLRFPSTTSKIIFRNHHISQMKRAIQHLDQSTTPHDFTNRLIFGITVACNKANLEEVKLGLHRALYEAAQKLSSGPCEDIYQLNLQIFPQSKK